MDLQSEAALQMTNLEAVPFPTTIEIEQPKYTKPDWWENPQKGDGTATGRYESQTGRLREIVKAFLTGTFKGRMRGDVGNGRHIYYLKNGDLWCFRNNPSVKVNVCIIKKVEGGFLGNASSLMAMRQRNSKKINWTGGAQKMQMVLSEVMPMVPFRMFTESRLDLDEMEIIEKAPDEMLELGRKVKDKIVKTHYTGAMLFKIGVRRNSQGVTGKDVEYFLFDIDRNDLKLKNFNAFLSKLSGPAKSIKEAYSSLKPKEVYDAERFLGRECPRQGEWFFIPVQGEFEIIREDLGVQGRPRNVEARLQSKGNRPHWVQNLSPEGYVKGKVTHGGFEHKPITLESWHKPVPNTAIESFKISGSVD